MGQENSTTREVKKGSHFNYEQRRILEWHWCGKGGKKERSLTRLGDILGKNRSTIFRELRRGMVEHLTTGLETVREYNAD